MNKIKVEDITEIEAPGSGHVGWSTLAKTKSGELNAVYSGGRQHHICPFGQVHIITSRDEGRTWTWPRTLVDGPLDDRDAGILQTSRSTLIVTWFTSLAWEFAMQQDLERWKNTSDTEQAEWQRRRERLTDDVRQRELGGWCIRSEDGGQTWSSRIPTEVNSPHGPCELSDGRLLYVGKKILQDLGETKKGGPFAARMGAAESTDDGQSWQWISEIPTMSGHNLDNYHELHAVQATDGTIIAHIRNHNELHKSEVMQTESSDGGHTWSTPHSLGLWGYPNFLLRMSDGRLMTTFGHRREPRGNQVAISEDNGKSWSEAIAINTDSVGDFGYPSTIEWTPGEFLSLWYDSKSGAQTSLRLARWRLE